MVEKKDAQIKGNTKMSGALISIAKELGIAPNPNLTQADIERDVPRILKKYGVDEKKQYGVDENNNDPLRTRGDLNTWLYDYKKKFAAKNREIDAKQYQKNLEKFTEEKEGRWVFEQGESFLWHGQVGEGKERLIIDINIDSPDFPKVSDKLDAFCRNHKWKVAYKIPTFDKAKRTDPMNIYSKEEFTPEMCAELVEILKPCLNGQYHDYLDGRPLLKNGQEIKGIKIGPEPSRGEGKSNWHSANEYAEKIKEDLGDNIWDTTRPYLSYSIFNAARYCSFGERTAALEVIALFYYLTGNEHKAPAIIQNHDGTPYVRLIDVDAKKDLSRESQGVAPQNGNQPSTLGQNTHKNMDEIFKEWSEKLKKFDKKFAEERIKIAKDAGFEKLSMADIIAMKTEYAEYDKRKYSNIENPNRCHNPARQVVQMFAGYIEDTYPSEYAEEEKRFSDQCEKAREEISKKTYEEIKEMFKEEWNGKGVPPAEEIEGRKIFYQLDRARQIQQWQDHRDKFAKEQAEWAEKYSKNTYEELNKLLEEKGNENKNWINTPEGFAVRLRMDELYEDYKKSSDKPKEPTQKSSDKPSGLTRKVPDKPKEPTQKASGETNKNNQYGVSISFGKEVKQRPDSSTFTVNFNKPSKTIGSGTMSMEQLMKYVVKKGSR